MSNIVIVDYQLGNLFSVNQALKNIGLETTITSDANLLKNADAVILPGVGAFGDAMENLRQLGLITPLMDYIHGGKPFMGICLGLQLLFTESEEFGASKGLNIIPGIVKRFSNNDIDGNSVKVPQIAWNRIFPSRNSGAWQQTPLEEVQEGEYMYFVHSFYVNPSDPGVALSKTIYKNTEYVSAIIKENIFACQFHPEKSAKEGLKIYQKWATINNLKK